MMIVIIPKYDFGMGEIYLVRDKVIISMYRQGSSHGNPAL